MEPVEPVEEVVEEDWGFDLGIRAVEAAICRKRGEGRIPVESVEESVFSNFGDLLFFAGQSHEGRLRRSRHSSEHRKTHGSSPTCPTSRNHYDITLSANTFLHGRLKTQ